MASSALPGPFATIALRNHEDCTERRHPWVDKALAGDDYLDRRRMVAIALKRYANANGMPILRLMDGGVTDNLGVRGSMMSPVAHYGTRDRLNAMPTTFRLNPDRVDTLIIESRNLLEQSEEFRAFLQRVQQTRARQLNPLRGEAATEILSTNQDQHHE